MEGLIPERSCLPATLFPDDIACPTVATVHMPLPVEVHPNAMDDGGHDGAAVVAIFHIVDKIPLYSLLFFFYLQFMSVLIECANLCLLSTKPKRDFLQFYIF